MAKHFRTLQEQYKKRVLIVHPDKDGTNEEFGWARSALQILTQKLVDFERKYNRVER